MHRYGVLGAYLPEFDAVVGRMQYDLFHAYTVDEHSLKVVGNLRAYAVEKHRAALPMCAEIFDRLPKPELLYIAGLFHDLPKAARRITRSWARSSPLSFAAPTRSANTIRGWFRGWCATTC
jgi:UTP:GlnB (protein PII) uridylyltransferase